MASQGLSGASTLSTSGDDDSNTRVTVNGTLFNSATATSTYNLTRPCAPGAVSGSVNLPVTGEGLAGEGSYADVIVSYSGNALQQRAVTASPIGLGRFMASQSVGGASTLSTSGDDDSNTRVTVNGTLFNSATATSTYNLASGTYGPGAVSGIGQPAGDGRRSHRRGQLCRRDRQLQRQRLAATHGHRLPIGLGRFMASQSVGGASTLSTSGDDDSNTRVTVNGTLFNSATATSTYNLTLEHLCAWRGERVGQPAGDGRRSRRRGQLLPT